MDEQAEAPSYHDVVVYVNGVEYRLTNDYSLQLICTKAAGWRLFRVWGEHSELIGGEYDGEPFRIEVRGCVIVDSSTQPKDDD